MIVIDTKIKIKWVYTVFLNYTELLPVRDVIPVTEGSEGRRCF